MIQADWLPAPIRSTLRRLALPARRLRFPGSATYWEYRYASGGNSGSGSYGAVARFKADTLNQFVVAHDVESVIEFGCGDGHQLSLADYPAYIGIDVSTTAIGQCRAKFGGDPSKTFLHASDTNDEHAELGLALDVLLHLVEEHIYTAYLTELFDRSERFVAVFDANRDEAQAAHVRYRRFTDWIEANRPDWQRLAVVANPHKGPESAADFYIYERT